MKELGTLSASSSVANAMVLGSTSIKVRPQCLPLSPFMPQQSLILPRPGQCAAMAAKGSSCME